MRQYSFWYDSHLTEEGDWLTDLRCDINSDQLPICLTDYDDLLDGAEEDDLKDIGAILGLNFFPELTKATK